MRSGPIDPVSAGILHKVHPDGRSAAEGDDAQILGDASHTFPIKRLGLYLGVPVRTLHIHKSVYCVFELIRHPEFLLDEKQNALPLNVKNSGRAAFLYCIMSGWPIQCERMYIDLFDTALSDEVK